MKIKKRYIALIIVAAFAIPIVLFLMRCLVWVHPIHKEIKAMSGKWESTLSNHLASADSVDVIEIPNTHLATITDKMELRRLIESVEIDEAESGWMCFCGGSPWFVFKEGTNELATISYHHNSHLRRKDGPWPGDGVLTGSSRNKICKWFEENNIKRANQKLQSTVKTPVESGNEQGTATEL